MKKIRSRNFTFHVNKRKDRGKNAKTFLKTTVFDPAKPQKSLLLHTSQEIRDYLKGRDKGKPDKIFFNPLALEGLEESLHPLVFEEIVRTNEKIVGNFIQATIYLRIPFENVHVECLKCLVLLYEELKHLVKIGELKNIRNIIAYTLKCFTAKKCTKILNQQRTIRLHTTEEIERYLEGSDKGKYDKFFLSQQRVQN